MQQSPHAVQVNFKPFEYQGLTSISAIAFRRDDSARSSRTNSMGTKPTIPARRCRRRTRRRRGMLSYSMVAIGFAFLAPIRGLQCDWQLLCAWKSC